MAERIKQDSPGLGGESHMYNHEESPSSDPLNSDISSQEKSPFPPLRITIYQEPVAKEKVSKRKDVFWFKHVNLIKLGALQAKEKAEITVV